MQTDTIGYRIRRLRIKKNISVAEMSIQTGISRQNIYFWETEQRKPDIDNLALLALFFNVTTDYLIFGR